MPRQSRRKHEDEDESQDRWLITYSDLITLLMIFFVIMYAMSNVNVQKMTLLAESLSNALHHKSDKVEKNVGPALLSSASQTNKGHKLTPGAANVTSKQDQTFSKLAKEIQQYINKHHLQANVQLQNQARGIQITFKDVVLFATGKAVVKPRAKTILKGLEPFLQKVQNPIVVEGYTDNRPIDTAKYPSNWELSSARAINVVRFFAGQGINPTRLSGDAYGQYHPLVPNTSNANRQKNRRINIVILRKSTTSSTAPAVQGGSSNSVS
ncbi:flagellar motor protein MotB [Alicyclobacillus sp. SO9]|uniref:flagellar motor protein MotB n=1 Tax=Alicyclobacillus sp. SO9 TaxID=2665646 RepID=UPI0018E7601B|nr:flagellar motor protein MotB [Alicyclobacillus sp. SO9]QQE79459.1 OmpA family protein [Alicyclobacillus sp. SO9]